MKRFVLTTCVLLLGACAAIMPKMPMYFGLDKNSYGMLVNYRDNRTQASITPSSCNPNATQYADVAEFSDKVARGITGFLASPLNGVEKMDDTITKEGLQNNFKITGDPSGVATVAILDRSDDGISFWYYADIVSLSEVANAASVFCKRRNREAAYEGSSRQCSKPILAPVVVNGQRTTMETYAISSFQCVQER